MAVTLSTTRALCVPPTLIVPFRYSTSLLRQDSRYNAFLAVRRSISSTTRTSKPLDTPLASSTSPVTPLDLPSAQSSPPAVSIARQTSPQPLSPLALLPLSSVLRTYLITTVSSSAFLLSMTSRLLQSMINSRYMLFNVERNPVLRWSLKKTFYAQFCAGEDAAEVRRFLKDVEGVGYKGVCLEYAMEVLEEEGHKDEVTKEGEQESDVAKEGIKHWKEGVLETIDMAKEGGFVAFKYSGAGPHILRLLKANSRCSPTMYAALETICSAAATRSIRLLPAAEPQNAQAAVDAWTLSLSRKYNRNGKAVLYNTYQCYLKSTPETVSKHLKVAEEEGWTLGVKLVRGAYMDTDQRNLIHDTKQDTDDAYDGLTAALLRGRWEFPLRTDGKEGMKLQKVDVMLATHNLRSVQEAMKIREERLKQKNDEAVGQVSYAQLLGMADEVSCALLASASSAAGHAAEPTAKPADLEPHVYKYATWGTLTQCLHYLLRRAAENRDAIGRTRETAAAMRIETFRRMRASLGLK